MLRSAHSHAGSFAPFPSRHVGAPGPAGCWAASLQRVGPLHLGRPPRVLLEVKRSLLCLYYASRDTESRSRSAACRENHTDMVLAWNFRRAPPGRTADAEPSHFPSCQILGSCIFKVYGNWLWLINIRWAAMSH